jgi:hypothetical protein
MEDKENKKATVVKLIKESARSPRKPRAKPAGVSVTVNAGDGDGHGIGNTIIKTEKVYHKTIATPVPGEEHVSEAQVARFHELADEIVKLEKLAGKRDPATHHRVWKSLNANMKVGAMRMIPADGFKAAEKYLLTWIARLTSTKTMQKKAPDEVRARRIRFIQVNMKKLGVEERVRNYMEKNFGVRSLTELTAEQMERTYRYVASLKK